MSRLKRAHVLFNVVVGTFILVPSLMAAPASVFMQLTGTILGATMIGVGLVLMFKEESLF